MYFPHDCTRFGLNFSPFGRNISFCAGRYGFYVDDVFFNKLRYFQWQYGTVGQINKVALHRARLVLGWVNISGLNSRFGKFISV